MTFPIGYEPQKIPINNPGARQVILVLPTGTMERVMYDPVNTKFKNSITNSSIGDVEIKSGLCIIEESIDLYEKDSKKFLQPLQEKGLIQSGNVLIQNTYNTEDYLKFDEEQIKTEVIFRKWQHYITVCNYLGATKIDLLNEINKDSDNSNNFGAKILNPLFKLNFKGKYFSKNIEQQLYKMSASFTGTPPNIKLAEEYIDKNYLYKDKDITFLVDNCKNNNRMLKFEQTLNLFSQIENGFNLAADINIPKYLVNGIGEFNQTNKKIEKFITKIELYFSQELPVNN